MASRRKKRAPQAAAEYTVVRDFIDRETKARQREGKPYTPATPDRADELELGGFIRKNEPVPPLASTEAGDD